jgi:TolB-like protein/DNA-binding winged helix-turn-helix (wHTH) protein/Tfp pilus assembly protein PilF
MAVNNENSAGAEAFERSATLRFGDFELWVKTAELRRNGRRVKLQNQPCRVLAILATHSGELVTRDELQQEIWPNGTFVDFEHGINFCIKQIRFALGDDAQSPTYIETLPRRGYRFIAPVQILNGTTGSMPAASVDELVGLREDGCIVGEKATEPADSDDKAESLTARASLWSNVTRLLSRVHYSVALLFVAALLMVGYLIWRRAPRVIATPAGRVMIAVIPFDYLGQDSGQQFFADGLTEEMIMQLGSLDPGRLGVIARTSVMRYRQAIPDPNRATQDATPIRPDIKQISKDLGVEYVLEGSIRPDGEQIGITARLIQSRDSTLLWSDSFETSRAGVLSVQKSIAARIARALAIDLLPATAPGPAAATTRDPQAHDLYLRAQYLKNKGDRASLERSADYFKQAVQQDSEYALAYSGLADSYRLLVLTGAALPGEAFPKSRVAASRALEIDDKLAEAHSAMGSALLWFDRSLPEAEREFHRAMELNPSYGWAHHDYAWLLVAAGRFDEAISQIKQAQSLDPLSPLANSDVGWVYLFSRRYDEAIDQIKRTLDLEPGFGSARACLVQAYIYKGMIEEALALGREEMTRAGAAPGALASIVGPDLDTGLRGYLEWTLERERNISGKAQPSHVRIAHLYAELGDEDRALESLAQALRYHDPMVVFLNVDPSFDSLRSDSRFVVLVQHSGL